MLTLRRSGDRGAADHGWLKSRFTFSFADYHDPRHMGFSTLRVINDDHVAPGTGFGKHPHKDMEIVTYVLSGALAHEDSMGNGSIIKPGDVQRMSAGTGVFHSEMNPSPDDEVHLLQIWIIPSERGIAPGYEQKHFDAEQKRGRLRLVASPDGADGSVTVHTNARVYATLLADGQRASLSLSPGRKSWVHVATGEMTVNGERLSAGDAAALVDEGELALAGAGAGGEALVFDLPA